MLTAASVARTSERKADGRPEPSAVEILAAVDGVSLAFHGRVALDKVSLAVHASEIVTLVGPNGAGKTTLARVLLGLTRANSGRVKKKERLKIGYVPQRFPIEPIVPLSVRRFMSLSSPVADATIRGCLAETGASSLIEAQMAELSGGEFQRVLLARALARDPELLVLDEPAQAVDFAGAAQLYRLITAIREKRGCGILLISHDLHVVMGASDRVICLNRHVCCEGVPAAVSGHPEYVRLFGPEAAMNFGFYRHSHDHSHDPSGGISREDPMCDARPSGCAHV